MRARSVGAPLRRKSSAIWRRLFARELRECRRKGMRTAPGGACTSHASAAHIDRRGPLSERRVATGISAGKAGAGRGEWCGVPCEVVGQVRPHGARSRRPAGCAHGCDVCETRFAGPTGANMLNSGWLGASRAVAIFRRGPATSQSGAPLRSRHDTGRERRQRFAPHPLERLHQQCCRGLQTHPGGCAPMPRSVGSMTRKGGSAARQRDSHAEGPSRPRQRKQWPSSRGPWRPSGSALTVPALAGRSRNTGRRLSPGALTYRQCGPKEILGNLNSRVKLIWANFGLCGCSRSLLDCCPCTTRHDPEASTRSPEAASPESGKKTFLWAISKSCDPTANGRSCRTQASTQVLALPSLPLTGAERRAEASPAAIAAAVSPHCSAASSGPRPSPQWCSRRAPQPPRGHISQACV